MQSLPQIENSITLPGTGTILVAANSEISNQQRISISWVYCLKDSEISLLCLQIFGLWDLTRCPKAKWYNILQNKFPILHVLERERETLSDFTKEYSIYTHGLLSTLNKWRKREEEREEKERRKRNRRRKTKKNYLSGGDSHH